MENDKANLVPFSIGDAIFHFLRLPGGRSFLWRLLAWLTVLSTLILVLFGSPVAGAYVDVFQVAMAAEQEPAPEDISKIFGALFSIIGFVLLLAVSFWALFASAETAFHKNAFHKFDGGFFPLRFGVAELRVALAQFIVNLISQGVYMAGYLAFIIIFLIAVAIGQAGVVGVVIGVIIGLCGFVAWMGSMAYVAIRLAPTAALSVRDDKITTVEGWKVTKGRAWPMFLSYVTVMAIGSVIFTVLFVLSIFPLSGLIAGLSELEGASEDDVAAVFESAWVLVKKPGVMIPLVLILLLNLIASLCMYAAYWGIASYTAIIDKTNTARNFN